MKLYIQTIQSKDSYEDHTYNILIAKALHVLFINAGTF